MTLPCKRAFRSSIEGPPLPLSTLQAASRDVACKTRGQDGFATLLSRRALSSPTTCRFIPALSESPTIQEESLSARIGSYAAGHLPGGARCASLATAAPHFLSAGNRRVALF